MIKLMIIQMGGVEHQIEEPLDSDVLEEQKRIRAELTVENTLQEGATNRDTVHICGLRKVYKKPNANPEAGPSVKVAVQDLWFGIPQGQVFGFLGFSMRLCISLYCVVHSCVYLILYIHVYIYIYIMCVFDISPSLSLVYSVNGAGKTTTLKMLTGDTHPSSGHAFIYGVSIRNQIEARRRIGYCPQFDAIFDLLTAYEHLKFYGSVKGLKGQELEDQIKVLLKALSLTKYRNRKAGTYSGGNKRKLSAAIAMIGNPPVVFLGNVTCLHVYVYAFFKNDFVCLVWTYCTDEPSTGIY
ncbi:ABC transporter family protein [Reticulomyxa filosa]|uniref:ABC transporter family protein n=1 Tax=Reticulomyxa filosa TaxID=46433 RepID=X6MA14_RETFI|nr:ABC transporter family protein [Reticulomyxa filosa]|eukprot:ETO10843.1 ABC transporter family protein [Reticulomyxa filosa]